MIDIYKLKSFKPKNPDDIDFTFCGNVTIEGILFYLLSFDDEIALIHLDAGTYLIQKCFHTEDSFDYESIWKSDNIFKIPKDTMICSGSFMSDSEKKKFESMTGKHLSAKSKYLIVSE